MYDVYTAENKWRAGTVNVFSVLGGIAGGAGGAALCAPTVIGSVACGAVGYEVGEAVFDADEAINDYFFQVSDE